MHEKLLIRLLIEHNARDIIHRERLSSYMFTEQRANFEKIEASDYDIDATNAGALLDSSVTEVLALDAPVAEVAIGHFRHEFAKRYLSAAGNKLAEIAIASNNMDGLFNPVEKLYNFMKDISNMRYDIEPTSIKRPTEYLRDFDIESIDKPLGYALSEFANLELLMRIVLGKVYMMTGQPGHGKSAFLNMVIAQTIKLYKLKWLVYSPENDPNIRFIRLAKYIFGRSSTVDNIGSVYQELDKHIRIMELAQNDKTVDAILNYVYEVHKSFGLDAFVIDPWNTLIFDSNNSGDRHNIMGDALRKIQDFCKRLDVLCIIVAHPTKAKDNFYKGGSNKVDVRPKPSLETVDGSKHFENVIDMGIVIYRHTFPDREFMEVHVQKIREHILYGRLGKAFFVLDEEGMFSAIDQSAVEDEYAKYKGKDTKKHWRKEVASQLPDIDAL